MNITNLNPDTDIGASAWLVEMDDHRILLDAGMHPKREGRDALPLFGKAGNADLDAIAISHCHHDHVGALPVACRHFPKAHVLMTELSYFIVERVLHNSVNVMTRQRDELGIREYPLYTHDEVDDIAPQFQGFKYNREVEWAAFQQNARGAAVADAGIFRRRPHARLGGHFDSRQKGDAVLHRRRVFSRPDDFARGAV